MTKIAKTALTALFSVALLSSTASADMEKGKKIYSKKLKGACGFTGAKFAASHTQDDWEALKEAGKFGEEVKKLCPKADKGYKEDWTADLYDFAYEYASDSGNVPSC